MLVQSSSRLPPPQTNGECLWPFNKRSGVALSRYIVHTLPLSTCRACIGHMSINRVHVCILNIVVPALPAIQVAKQTQGWILSPYRGEYCLHAGVNIVAIQGWILSPYRDEYCLHTGVNIVSIQGWILSPQPLLSSVTPEVQLWQEPRHAEPEPPGGAGRGHGRGRGDQRRSRWRPGPAPPPPPAPATARHQQEQVRPQDAAGPVTRKCFTFHSKIFDAKTINIFYHSIRSAEKILTFTHSFVTSF